MRLRTDSAHIAGWLRAHALRGCHCDPQAPHIAHDPLFSDTPVAEPGDVWAMTMHDSSYPGVELTGYALTCPDETCEAGVHSWTHAWDCSQPVSPDHRSCWTWTGSAEDGTLTASPSLLVTAGCLWHGWLRDGEMVSGMSERSTFLLLSDFERLEEWCRLVDVVFDHHTTYLVGSTHRTADYRDVDLRCILRDAVFDRWWSDPLKVRYVNRAISIWGQKETGLPIDFQVQRMTEANEQYGDQPRNPMGFRDWSRERTSGVPHA